MLEPVVSIPYGVSEEVRKLEDNEEKPSEATACPVRLSCSHLRELPGRVCRNWILSDSPGIFRSPFRLYSALHRDSAICMECPPQLAQSGL